MTRFPHPSQVYHINNSCFDYRVRSCRRCRTPTLRLGLLVLTKTIAVFIFTAQVSPIAWAEIFVSDDFQNTIGDYSVSGAGITPSLIPGLTTPYGLAVSGGNLFVASGSLGNGRIGEYDATSGAAINANLISGLSQSSTAIAVSGGDIFVLDQASTGAGVIKEFDAVTGASVNDSLVSGLTSRPLTIAVSGGNLYVMNEGTFNANGYVAGSGTIGEYNATTGATVNAALLSGLALPGGFAVSGGTLFVTSTLNNTIGEYNAATGATVNSAFVSGLVGPGAVTAAGGNLFVSEGFQGNARVGEYNAVSGAAINKALVSGLYNPVALAIKLPESLPPLLAGTAARGTEKDDVPINGNPNGIAAQSGGNGVFQSQISGGSGTGRGVITGAGPQVGALASGFAEAQGINSHSAEGTGRGIAWQSYVNATDQTKIFSINAVLEGTVSNSFGILEGRVDARISALDPEKLSSAIAAGGGDATNYFIGLHPDYGTYSSLAGIALSDHVLNEPFSVSASQLYSPSYDLKTGVITLLPGESFVMLFDVYVDVTGQAGIGGGVGTADFLHTLSAANNLFTDADGNPVSGIVLANVPEPSTFVLGGLATVALLTFYCRRVGHIRAG